MKKQILLLTLSVISVASLTAQVKKGNTYLGLKFSTNTNMSRPYDDKLFNWLNSSQIQLEAGKALNKNLVAGARIGFGSTPQNSFIVRDSVTSYTNNPYVSADLFLRRYMQLGKKFSLYGEVALTHTSGRYTFIEYNAGNSYDARMRSNIVSLGASAGFSYEALKWLSLEMSVNNLLSMRYSYAKGQYHYFATGQNARVKTSQWVTDPFNGMGRTVSIGIKIRLGKK